MEFQKKKSKKPVQEIKNVYIVKKKIIYPFDVKRRKNSATLEHLNYNGPFHWDKGLKIEDVAYCCGSCNSSRGEKKLMDWFKTEYCLERNINENTVSKTVKEYIKRKRKNC